MNSRTNNRPHVRRMYCVTVLLVHLVLGGCAGAGIGSGGTYPSAWGVQEKCRAVHFWVANFWSKLPKPPEGTPSHLAYHEALAINLFRDEYFLPVFGSSFGQMSMGDRQTLGTKVERCFVMNGPDTYKDMGDLSRYYGPVMSHWNGDGAEFSNVARSAKEWQERIIKELASGPPSEETFIRYLDAKRHAKDALARFLPSERQAFSDRLDQEARRLAEPVLVGRVTKASAVSGSYEGLKQLQGVVDDDVGLFKLVSSEVKTRERVRAAKAYQDGLAIVMETEWNRFEARGSGLAAITNGVAWYREFEDRYYGTFDIGPPVHALIRRVQEARGKDFQSARDKVIQALGSPPTAEWLQRKRDEYLIIGVDEFVAEAQPIYAWITFQETKINFQKDQWKFSKNELGMMKIPGVVTVPDTYDPPTGEDVRMALLRAYVAAGGRLVDRNTATVVTGSFDDLLGTLGRGGLPRMSIGTVSVGNVIMEGCSEGRGSSSVGLNRRSKGFVCRYTADGQSSSDDFILTSEGWLSPTADDRAARKRNQATMKMLETIGSAVPKVGCLGPRGTLYWWCR